MTLSQDIELGFVTRLMRLIKLRLNASIGNAPTLKGFPMRLFFFSLLSAVFFACADNPLAERVDELEQRLDEVEAAQEEDRLSLLARLDALAVTADNAEEIGQVRAKLNQTSITRSEFEDLQERVEELEGQIGDWSGIVHSLQYSVYAVLHGVYNENIEDWTITFIGTSFAVESGTLVTNGHIIDGLIELDGQVATFNNRYGTDLQGTWIVVQNLTTDLSYQENYFFIGTYWSHPQWDPEDLSSPDVGTLHISEGFIGRRVRLATSNAVYRLRVGAPIATLGFPGELQGGELSHLFPIGTFKNGTISALRPPFRGEMYTTSDSYVVQHNLDLSGGTSGSPIFDASGQVVAINNAGIENVVLSIVGTPARISQAALGFGIRADKIHELLDEVGVVAKPTTNAASGLANSLDGRDIGSLDIGTTQEDLAERLAGME